MSDRFPLCRNAQLHTEYISTGALSPMPGAPRRHPKSQIRSLTKSIEAFGQVLPILIDADNRIISGHALWEVARKLGLAEVMVIRVHHLSELQLKALMLALNRIGDLSKWDDAALRDILLDLSDVDLDFDIEATGFTEIEIELRIHNLDIADGENEAPILVGDGPTITTAGDVWQLGQHMLICGNALDQAVWTTLMGEDRAVLVVTDPPFNVPIDGHVSGEVVLFFWTG